MTRSRDPTPVKLDEKPNTPKKLVLAKPAAKKIDEVKKIPTKSVSPNIENLKATPTRITRQMKSQISESESSPAKESSDFKEFRRSSRHVRRNKEDEFRQELQSNRLSSKPRRTRGNPLISQSNKHEA